MDNFYDRGQEGFLWEGGSWLLISIVSVLAHKMKRSTRETHGHDYFVFAALYEAPGWSASFPGWSFEYERQ